MTNRSPISGIQNIFFDSEQLDNTDLTVEQNYNNNFQTSFVNNQVGAGILPEALTQNVIFNSSLVSGLLDGVAIEPQAQPSDNNLGNQLEVELTNSNVAGKRTLKCAIIGLDFQGNLQYDTFTFKLNEKQITKKHYSSVLTILFNDFIGQPTQSFNLGGNVIIREVKPFSISRDPIMASQDVEPNLFWRDFFLGCNTCTLQNFLSEALPLFNVDNLDINTGFLQYTPIYQGDVTTQVGEKFLATTNNIQKITLLLAVQNSVAGQSSVLTWHGDLIISIYPLQSTIACPTDLIPNLPIDYSPSNIPLAQVSFNYASLQAMGVTLDGNAQPVDFFFSNTPVASGNSIVPGQYYAVTVKRSGSADQCDILIATGGSYSNTSWVTTFNGSLWVDIPEQELWFRVWTDAAKVSDGQAYETGHGVIIPKTQLDPITNTTVDYYLTGIPFTGNELYTAVVEATVKQSGTVQDQRTGNPIQSRQQFVPTVDLLNPIDLTNLENTSEPLTIGLIIDQNEKSFDSSSATLTAALHSWNFIDNKFVIKIIDDITDGYRYDPNVNALVSNLVNGDFTNAQIVPDATNPNIFYRIALAELVTMIYGDVDGNGIVDSNDLALLNAFIGMNLNSAPPTSTSIVTDGYHTSFTNGYPVYSNEFNNDYAIIFQVVNNSSGAVLASSNDGILFSNPNNVNLATFKSGSTNFNDINLIGDCILVIQNSNYIGNVGGFSISGVDASSNNIIDISKVYVDSDVMMQMLRSDIDGDFIITENDGYLLQQYINKAPPFPTSTLPESKIGTTFTVIKLSVDPFIFNNVPGTITDRTDDYPSTATNRATTIHTPQDIFLNDGYFASHNFMLNPIPFNIVKQFTWESDLISAVSKPRFVPTVFSSLNGLSVPSYTLTGVTAEVFPAPPSFDPGLINTFIPNNLIIGSGGNFLNEDESFYKVDFEIGTIILEIPDGFFGIERTIDIFGDFVADYTGAGVTRLGYPALRFSDGTFVQNTALTNSQVQFSASVQSFSPNINGLDPDGYTGAIVDGKIGVSMDYGTGLLTLNFTNLYQDSVLQTLNTKIQVNVFVKKGGFNNVPIFVNSDKVQNMLELISVFSGAGTNGGPIVMVDLATETFGELPSPSVAYEPAAPSNWAGTPPNNLQDALDRVAAALSALSHKP